MTTETQDAQDLASRRALKHVVARLLDSAERARDLLKPKAERSPTSAEADAWRILERACDEAHRWMSDAGG